MGTGTPASAHGTIYSWSTSNSTVYSTKSAGCQARGYSSTSSDYATTVWTSFCDSAHATGSVQVRGYIYAGAQSYYTLWNIRDDDAYVASAGLISAQHKIGLWHLDT